MGEKDVEDEDDNDDEETEVEDDHTAYFQLVIFAVN